MGARGWIIVCITHHLVVERLHFKFNYYFKSYIVSFLHILICSLILQKCTSLQVGHIYI